MLIDHDLKHKQLLLVKLKWKIMYLPFQQHAIMDAGFETEVKHWTKSNKSGGNS